MSVELQLSTEEARLLALHLERYTAHLDAELVRTDKRELQKELSAEIARLREIRDRLEAAAPSLRQPVARTG
jgi:hypothetical protein